MVATAIYSLATVLWKEIAFLLCTAMKRRWERNCDVSRVSSLIMVIRLLLFVMQLVQKYR